MSTLAAAETIEQSAQALFGAFQAGDRQALGSLLADDVALNSPITGRLRFRGRERVLDLFEVVRAATSDVERAHLFGDGDRWVQVVHGTAGGRRFELGELLEFDSSGRIRELTIFVRPMPALIAFAAAIVPRAARRRSRAAALLLGAMVKPLVPLTERGDKVAVAVLRDAWS